MEYADREIDFRLLSADGRAMGEGRTPNSLVNGVLTVHLSSILRFMESSMQDRQTAADGNPMWAAFGFMFERWIEKALVEYYGFQRALRIEQGEQLCDNVLLTGDALNLADGVYEEYKVRWRSARKFMDAGEWERWFWKELRQVMANCYVYGTLKARLIVFFVCGDWKPPQPWPPVCRELTFTQAELDHNWQVLQGNRRAMERMVNAGEMRLEEL